MDVDLSVPNQHHSYVGPYKTLSDGTERAEGTNNSQLFFRVEYNPLWGLAACAAVRLPGKGGLLHVNTTVVFPWEVVEELRERARKHTPNSTESFDG